MRFLFVLTGWLTVAGAALAQSPADSLPATLATQAADSLLNQRLAETSLLLQNSEQQRLIDSLQKIAIERELLLLKSSDRQRRAELEGRIAQIEAQDSLRLAEQRIQMAALKRETKGFPVTLFADTLFYLFNKIGPFAPQERAENIMRKVVALYQSGSYDASALQVVESESSYDLMYGQTILMSVTDRDALWQEVSSEQLARQYRAAIDGAIREEVRQNSLGAMAIRVGEVLLVVVCIAVLLYLLNRLFGLTARYLRGRLTRRGIAVRLRDYEMLSQERLVDLALWFNRALKTVCILLALYLALPLIFSIFVSTRGWASLLLGWILTPVADTFRALISYLPNLFTILVIYLMVRYVVRAVRFMAGEVASGKLRIGGFHADWALPTFNIVRILLYAFMFIVIFPYLPGAKSPVFQGVSVFLGILFSLGSSSAISNAVAGMVITYMRPFRLGDRIKIGEIAGDVIEKNLLVTRIRTIKNEKITVPNSAILSGHTINYTTSSSHIGLILHSTVTIGYDVPWPQVHQALTEAALRCTWVLKEPAPFVLQTSLEDFYVSYQINAYTANPHKQAFTYSELHQHIQDVFNASGIEILSPHYRGMRDGNATTIPAHHLPDHYQAPSFRVSYDPPGKAAGEAKQQGD